jgi:hypothetical protein
LSEVKVCGFLEATHPHMLFTRLKALVLVCTSGQCEQE